MALTGIMMTPGLQSQSQCNASPQAYCLAPLSIRHAPIQTKIIAYPYSCIWPFLVYDHLQLVWALLQTSCHPRRISLGLQLRPKCCCCSNRHLAACSSEEIQTMVKHLHRAHTRPLANGMLSQPSTQCWCGSILLLKRVVHFVSGRAGVGRLPWRQWAPAWPCVWVSACS